jgi:hypothetical protein
MTNRPRNLVAVLIVVTALFADRAAWGAPVSRPQVVEQTAARIIDRLTVKFRRAVPVAALYEHRTNHVVTVVTTTRPNDMVPPAREPAHRPSLPTFFRLPPPTVA